VSLLYPNKQQKRQDRVHKIQKMKFTFCLLLCSLAVLAFRLHLKTYNVLYGPFHANLSNIYSRYRNYEGQFYWSFYTEYLELELGEDQIEEGPQLYTYHYLHPYRYPSTVFQKVKRIETNNELRCIVRNLNEIKPSEYDTWHSGQPSGH
jgi:hypothetical protein